MIINLKAIKSRKNRAKYCFLGQNKIEHGLCQSQMHMIEKARLRNNVAFECAPRTEYICSDVRLEYGIQHFPAAI